MATKKNEDITILVPTWNRSNFLPLFLMNLTSQTYQHKNIKVIIDDDGAERFISDLQQVKDFISPITIDYITDKPKRTIGKKRHDLIKACKTKIFCFMDDDDIYIPTYLEHSYQVMKEKKVGCVGSDKMIFCMTQNNFAIHAIDCGNNARLIHEATIMMTQKFYKSSCGFENSSQGEGANLFTGNTKNVAITDINKIMVCVAHADNTVAKQEFAKDENKLNIEMSDDIIAELKNILKL
tara:strand:- start:342 stop:1055 length:714 start_codon:yes stop_codon:yes gene_type:complete